MKVVKTNTAKWPVLL